MLDKMNKETRSEKSEARVHSAREARGTDTAVFVRVKSYLSFVQPLHMPKYVTLICIGAVEPVQPHSRILTFFPLS